MRTITALYQYPIKSCQGMTLESCHVGDKGPGLDRRWMVVDATGRFMSQRQLPQMALIKTRLEGNLLFLHIPNESEIPLPLLTNQNRDVSVWDDTCKAEDQGDAAAAALSKFLGKECRLVFMPEDTKRQVKEKYAISPENHFGFADGYPFLLISEASLEDLNRRLESPVPMNRFRPNIVVSGCEPYEEDTWKWIRIGDILFKGAKPCSRCGLINVEQSRGERGTEPFLTLSAYRKVENKVYFGLNMIHANAGNLYVGQHIEVLETANALESEPQSLT